MAATKAADAEAVEVSQDADHVAPASAGADPGRDRDRVAIVSLRADGTPDQHDGFEILPES